MTQAIDTSGKRGQRIRIVAYVASLPPAAAGRYGSAVTTESHIQLTALLDGTDGSALAETLREVLAVAGIREPDFGSTGSGWSKEPLDPPRATLSFSLLSDNPSELLSAVSAVEAGLVSAGVVLSEPPAVVSSKVVTAPQDSPRDGLHWDDDSRTLTIDGQAERSSDVEIQPVSSAEGITVLVAVGMNSPGGRREFAFPRVRVLIVKRSLGG